MMEEQEDEDSYALSGRRSDSSGKFSYPWAEWERSSQGQNQQGEAGDAVRHDIASSVTSSDDSWWKGGWQWDAWDGASNSSRENWVYVSRKDEKGSWGRSDPWHRWHASDDSWSGRDGQGRGSGEGGRSERLPDHEPEQGRLSGESEEEGGCGRGLPTGKIESIHDKADKNEEKRIQGKVSSSYPPVFKAKQGENYREWKRSVKFWLRGEGQSLPTSLVGPRVMVQLRERAAQLVKHLEPEDVDGTGGLDLIFQTLERSPLIRQSEKHRVDWHRKRLLNLSRMAGESLESYITRASLYRDQLAGLDASLSMGERFFVGHLLDHAKLTRRDKAMLKTHAGEDSEIGITGAMMELSAELEGEAGFPIGQAEGQLSGAQGEEFMVQRGVVGFRFPRTEKAALAAEVQDAETATQMSFHMESVPEEPGGEESLDEGDAAMPADVLHAEHEALALQYKARQKMAEVKKLRNFYRKNEDGKKPKLVKCFVCDEPGHIARDCPKVRGTLNSSNQVLVATSQPPGKNDPEEMEWDLLASLRSITEELPNKAKEVYMVQSGVRVASGNEETSFDTGIVPYEAWWNMRELAKRVILDLGCMRNVVGVKWATDVLDHWRSQGRWFKIIPEAEVFRFGDGNTLRSRYRLQLEATFGGRRVLLAFSVVPGPCPPLLSKQSHTKLGVKIDTEHHALSSRKLKVQSYGLTETDAGHYTMRIDEFHLLSPEEEAWQEGAEFVMLSDEEVALFEPIQPDVEVFGSCVDPEQELGKLNGFHLPSSSQSAAMSSLRVAAASDKGVSGLVGDHEGAPGEDGRRSTERGGRAAEGPEGSTSEYGSGEAAEGTSLSRQVEVGSDIKGFGTMDGSTTRRVHGCSNARTGSRRSSLDHEETGEASSIQEQEGTGCCVDGLGGQLPLPIELLERGVDLQHHSQHREPLANIPMEEVGVAAEDPRSSESGVEGEGYLAEESQVADLPSELRDCGVVGPLWCDEAEAEVERLPGDNETLSPSGRGDSKIEARHWRKLEDSGVGASADGCRGSLLACGALRWMCKAEPDG